MANAPYLEMAFVILVTNIRYLLMSCALSQRFDPGTSLFHRILAGFGITDEIFGISIGRAGALNPYYNYGAMAIALPSWSLGTACGIVAGNILPVSVVSALSVALYGMFIAIVAPAAAKSRPVLGVVAAAVALSCAIRYIPALHRHISGGFAIILCTLLAAGAGALLAPIREKTPAADPPPARGEADA